MQSLYCSVTSEEEMAVCFWCAGHIRRLKWRLTNLNSERCLYSVEIREPAILPESSVYGPNVGTLSESLTAVQGQLRHFV